VITEAELRKVNTEGDIYINDTPWKVSKALRREMVQIQRLDQRILVFYCKTLVREIDLSAQRSTAVDR
ncbi:MAG: IS481 family transposase, partial [Terracidiphilus sp.]